MLPVLRRIEDTDAIQTLRKMEASPLSSFYDRMETLRLLVPQELWARAYAQYIALRSEDETMKQEVALRRSDDQELLPHLEYWAWPDFKEIATEIDAFVEKRGWRL